MALSKTPSKDLKALCEVTGVEPFAFISPLADEPLKAYKGFMSSSLMFSIHEMSGVGEARRGASHLTHNLGFSEMDAERTAIVTTEAATNLVKHAGGGQILFRVLDNQGVEILALDKGNGISNLGEAMRDGFSTGSSPGNGLGAIARLSTLFQIHSQFGRGTALLSQIWPKNQASEVTQLAIGAVCVAHPKEYVCGDGWIAKGDGKRNQILIADGLGHGEGAAASANEAIHLFSKQENFSSPVETLKLQHQGLRHTRGAAIAIAEIADQQVHFAGIGNIAAVIFTPRGQKHLVSYNGIVGHEARKIAGFDYDWEADSLLILHSDGLQTRWNLESYAGLGEKHPSLIAGVLYRDFSRGNDDVTVLVVKQK